MDPYEKIFKEQFQKIVQTPGFTSTVHGSSNAVDPLEVAKHHHRIRKDVLVVYDYFNVKEHTSSQISSSYIKINCKVCGGNHTLIVHLKDFTYSCEGCDYKGKILIKDSNMKHDPNTQPHIPDPAAQTLKGDPSIPSQEQVWKSSGANPLRLCNMDDDHVKNAIYFLEKKVKERVEFLMTDKQTSQTDRDRYAEGDFSIGEFEPIYKNLLLEVKRRGLDI